MSRQNLTPADVFVNSLKAQRNGALDAVALRDAEVAAIKAELSAALLEIEKLKKPDDNSSAA